MARKFCTCCKTDAAAAASAAAASQVATPAPQKIAPQGPPGPKGDQGFMGPQGPTGATGANVSEKDNTAAVLLFDEHFTELIDAAVIAPSVLGDGDAVGNGAFWKIANNNGSASAFVLTVGDDVNHWGCWNVGTAATSTTASVLYKAASKGDGVSTTDVCIDPDHIVQFDVWVKLLSTADCSVQVGFSSDASDGTPNDGMLIRFTDGSNGNVWHGRCRAGNLVSTVRDSAVVVVASSWYKLTMKRTGPAAVQCFVNDVFFGTVTERIPTAPLVPVVYISTSANAIKSVIVDRFRCYVLPSGTWT